MTYYRFKGKDDLFLGKYVSKDAKKWKNETLIPNELLDQKQVDSLKKEWPKLSVDKTFEKIELDPGETYVFSGVRFQDGWDHNGKQENVSKAMKLRIKEKHKK